MSKSTAIKERMTKTQLINELSENTGLSKSEVKLMFDELNLIIERHLKSRSCGEFILPNILKIRKIKTPAKKAQKNVPNPFKDGETWDIKAKPANTKIKITPLSLLKNYIK